MILLAQAVLSVLAWAAIALSTVLWSSAMGIFYPFHRFWDRDRKILHRMAGSWGRGLVRMAPAARVEISGLDQIPCCHPVILMANHQSYVDVPGLFFLPLQFRWMADEELFRVPFLGWAIRLAGYVPVRRGDARSGLDALERAKHWLGRGVSVFIFPEGTRSHTGLLGRFQTGGFRLAVETGTPILPVIVVGSRQLLPRGSWIFRWGAKIQIKILPPVAPSRGPQSIRRLMSRVRALMRQEYGRLVRERRPPATVVR